MFYWNLFKINYLMNFCLFLKSEYFGRNLSVFKLIKELMCCYNDLK